MKDLFYGLADHLCAGLQGEEVLALSFGGEESDFVRFNRSRVRQAGSVRQLDLTLELIRGTRHALFDHELSGDPGQDLATLTEGLDDLRALLPALPEDPHLLYATEVRSSAHQDVRPNPDARAIASEVARSAADLDLVGLLAAGRIHQGFANSLGQRNWHESVSFNMDWSCYLGGDKAVKAHYAGSEWSSAAFTARLERMRRDLEVMARPPVRLTPGEYRAYLAPAALRDILDMMSWDGFGLKAHRSAETPLIRMVRDGARLSPLVTLAEDAASGIAPRFTSAGFEKQERVVLIESGRYRDCLVGPRSAKEFGVPVTGEEGPECLDLAPGGLPSADVLAALDTGLYINNLWYCNFSDHDACRITGMTRFACLWVEQGEVKAPVEVLRFDDSIYHLLGDRLLDLTRERDLILDGDTYGGRSTDSYRLPGALVSGMRFTL